MASKCPDAVRSAPQEFACYQQQVAEAKRESTGGPERELQMQEWHDWRHSYAVRRIRFLAGRH